MSTNRRWQWKVQSRYVLLLLSVLLTACTLSSETTPAKIDLEITQRWQGVFPVAQLHRLPVATREMAAGYISDADTFATIWQAFKPAQSIPKVDFNRQLVVYARNIHFYNRNNILKVTLDAGTITVISMETMSAISIGDKVAMSMAVIPAKDVRYIQVGDTQKKIDR